MDINTLINDYNEIKECTYKGEIYSVRDNGAVLRHARDGKRIRKEDEIWTFGKPNINTGYMEIGSERVHRIVAFAFLGTPPSSQHIVDHIDTNRRNNRPENLRWFTRLENVLNNPFTRRKIEYLCGSIEVFINNPSIIQNFVDQDPNFKWMRTVTKEEAQAAYKNISTWLSKPRKGKQTSGSFGEWIYQPYTPTKEIINNGINTIINQPKFDEPQEIVDSTIPEDYQDCNLTESLTPNAIQRKWRTPTEFPLCPTKIGEQPIISYFKNLKKNAIASKNQYSTHYIDDFALCDNNSIIVTTYANEGLKKYSIITITFEDGKFVHEGRTCFERRSTQKEITLAKGLEWTGGEVLDDYC